LGGYQRSLIGERKFIKKIKRLSCEPGDGFMNSVTAHKTIYLVCTQTIARVLGHPAGDGLAED
jgi:hypothetical protein